MVQKVAASVWFSGLHFRRAMIVSQVGQWLAVSKGALTNLVRVLLKY